MNTIDAIHDFINKLHRHLHIASSNKDYHNEDAQCRFMSYCIIAGENAAKLVREDINTSTPEYGTAISRVYAARDATLCMSYASKRLAECLSLLDKLIHHAQEHERNQWREAFVAQKQTLLINLMRNSLPPIAHEATFNLQASDALHVANTRYLHMLLDALDYAQRTGRLLVVIDRFHSLKHHLQMAARGEPMDLDTQWISLTHEFLDKVQYPPAVAAAVLTRLDRLLDGLTRAAPHDPRLNALHYMLSEARLLALEASHLQRH